MNTIRRVECGDIRGDTDALYDDYWKALDRECAKSQELTRKQHAQLAREAAKARASR